ncbi:MAG: non-hydrolyzing UDP-N-acetylglucosamine 2-epimerase, partial [Candidatus Kapaibacterium sp.]
VNSTIACVLTAAKLHIPTAHVEAGLRSGDRSMPEEINRIATDAISDYCFVTEQSGLDHLAESGYPADRTFFVGNTMIDSLHYALPKAERSTILEESGLKGRRYVLATLHRPSNVDEKAQLSMLLELFATMSNDLDIVFPVHPRTRKKAEEFGLNPLLDAHPRIRLIEPQGYVSFLALMRHADFVMTDSGGIQEETTALGVPCLTLRTTTERPSTVDMGTNILIPPERSAIEREIALLLGGRRKTGSVPPLWDGHAAERIAGIVMDTIFGP